MDLLTHHPSPGHSPRMSVSVVDFQEQEPMIISAERYSDPSNRRKVIQATKEKESKEILANITVDKVHHSKVF